jgi:hypothetical protein
MRDEELIKAEFLKFIFDSMDKVDRGSPGDNARFVTGVVFDTIVTTWEDAHGAKKMAEYFYQIADALVAKSNMENFI